MAQIEYIILKHRDHQKKAHVLKTFGTRVWSFCGWTWEHGSVDVTLEKPDDICSRCLNRREYKALVAQQEPKQ